MFLQLILSSHAGFNPGLQIILCCHANIVSFIPKSQALKSLYEHCHFKGKQFIFLILGLVISP